MFGLNNKAAYSHDWVNISVTCDYLSLYPFASKNGNIGLSHLLGENSWQWGKKILDDDWSLIYFNWLLLGIKINKQNWKKVYTYFKSPRSQETLSFHFSKAWNKTLGESWSISSFGWTTSSKSWASVDLRDPFITLCKT